MLTKPQCSARPEGNGAKEARRARAWRERQGLTVEELSRLTGYTVRAIYWFERGEQAPRTGKAYGGKRSTRPVGRPVADKVGKKPGPAHSISVWTRYKMTCAGVMHVLSTGKRFDW
jgi:Helix-turn-helix domain